MIEREHILTLGEDIRRSDNSLKAITEIISYTKTSFKFRGRSLLECDLASLLRMGACDQDGAVILELVTPGAHGRV